MGYDIQTQEPENQQLTEAWEGRKSWPRVIELAGLGVPNTRIARMFRNKRGYPIDRKTVERVLARARAEAA